MFIFDEASLLFLLLSAILVIVLECWTLLVAHRSIYVTVVNQLLNQWCLFVVETPLDRDFRHYLQQPFFIYANLISILHHYSFLFIKKKTDFCLKHLLFGWSHPWMVWVIWLGPFKTSCQSVKHLVACFECPYCVLLGII